MEAQILHRLDSLEQNVQLLFKLYEKVSDATKTRDDISNLQLPDAQIIEVASTCESDGEQAEIQKKHANLQSSGEIKIQKMHDQDGRVNL